MENDRIDKEELNTQEVLDNDPDVQRLREEIKILKNTEELQKEKAGLLKEKREILNRERQREFRAKHPKLLKFTGAVEKGTVGFFKKLGSGIKKTIKGTVKATGAAADKLNKMDQKIAELQRREMEQKQASKNISEICKKQKEKDRAKSDVDKMLNLLD